MKLYLPTSKVRKKKFLFEPFQKQNKIPLSTTFWRILDVNSVF